MKLKWLLALFALVSLALGVCWFLGYMGGRDASSKRRSQIERRVQKKWGSAKEAVAESIAGKVKPFSRSSNDDGWPDNRDLFEDFKPVDRKLAQAVQDALDDNDFARVVAAAQKAAKSTNPEVRQNAVEALGWFGPEALPELTSFIADPNEEVADAAVDQWQQALSMVEEDAVRISTAEAALKTLSNETALNQIVFEITSQDDDLKVMQSLVDIIDSGNPVGVKVAKEEYETLTGEEWTGIDAAEKWLDENYESDDSKEE